MPTPFQQRSRSPLRTMRQNSRGLLSGRVVGREVARGAVDAARRVVAGEVAERRDLRAHLERLAGRVAAERLEARLDPGLLDRAARRRGRGPVEAVQLVDPRGDHEVAVELVPLLHLPAREDAVVVAHPLRLDAVARRDVLHEDAARAGALVPLGLRASRTPRATRAGRSRGRSSGRVRARGRTGRGGTSSSRSPGRRRCRGRSPSPRRAISRRRTSARGSRGSSPTSTRPSRPRTPWPRRPRSAAARPSRSCGRSGGSSRARPGWPRSRRRTSRARSSAPRSRRGSRTPARSRAGLPGRSCPGASGPGTKWPAAGCASGVVVVCPSWPVPAPWPEPPCPPNANAAKPSPAAVTSTTIPTVVRVTLGMPTGYSSSREP